MAIELTENSMTSDRSTHTAELRPTPEADHGPATWRVSWCPDQALGRNEAITAMVLADVIGKDEPDLSDHNRLFVGGWAAELGMSADEAVRHVRQPQKEIGE